ncbi:hypothetical protein [Micromonospora sp. MA102]|uniref:hypothetical protein n=1 Tax=Micromonospora sp. MA102 TaxID=2952755 RepID=UPI0021C9B48A|nr:hypothetical protein [Micromonospora sp. MA102]
MTAEYHAADTENGDHIDDPSEDALFMLINQLGHPDNTFVTITPGRRQRVVRLGISTRRRQLRG